jgi:hypothetical protein
VSDPIRQALEKAASEGHIHPGDVDTLTAFIKRELEKAVPAVPHRNDLNARYIDGWNECRKLMGLGGE